MNEYDYREALKDDIREYLEDQNFKTSDYESIDQARESIYEDLWVEDSVTGNGSGSYTFNRWQAEEYLCHNFDLLQEAYEEFGYGTIQLDNPEASDVTIRCYLLGECLEDVLGEYDWEEEE